MKSWKYIHSLTIVAFLFITSTLYGAEVVSKISAQYEDSSAYWNASNSTLRSQLNLPYYFNALYGSMNELSDSLVSQRDSKSLFAPVLFNYRELNKRNNQRTERESQLGLRLITVRSDDRLATSQALADSGIFETGDIVLSFRPEWYTTLRYSHIQLGISHAGVLYITKGKDGKNYLKNLDMPMDDEHVGAGYMNSKHYLGAPYLHVVRARNLNVEQKANLEKWLKRLSVNGPKAYSEGKIRFNKDYSAPKYRANEPMKFVGDVGRIALQINFSEQLTEYCSEFAWSILSLRDCNPDDAEVRDAFAKQDAPSCIREIFTPMPVFGDITTAQDKTDATKTVGLADGIPLISNSQFHYISDLNQRASLQTRLIRKMVFSKASGKGERISQGHLAVEQGLGEDFFGATLNYYSLLTAPNAAQNPHVMGIRQAVNAKQPANYSPTAFMVHTLLPVNAQIRAFDYVGTLFYAQKIRLKGKEVDAYKALRSLKIQ